MKNNQFDYFNNELEDLDDLDDYEESFTSKQKFRKNENIEDLMYSEEEVRKFYIYPLYTLRGKKVTDGLRIAKDKITIMATMPKNVIKINGYLSSNEDDYDLTETYDPVNPTEQLMRVSDIISFRTSEISEVDTSFLYLLTKEAINENNFKSIKQYIGKVITPDIDDSGIEMSFSSLEEFSSSFRTAPIKIVLSEPVTNKISELHVTSPKGTLIGNIKVVDEDGRFPNLIANEETEIYPKLCFPFQTEPVLSIVDYWSSDQIVQLRDIFAFLDSKGIKYNEEFSLSEFLKLGGETNYPTLNVNHAIKLSFDIIGSAETGKWFFNQATNQYFWSPEKNIEKTLKFDYEKDKDFIYETSVSPRGNTHDLKMNIKQIEQVNVVPIGVTKNSSAFETLLKMLTESFWKDYEFKGATISNLIDGKFVEEIRDWGIYELMQKYSGQDRYSVTTNLWLSWKKINQDKVNANLAMVKRIENCMAMLSGYIKSNFSINKGDNDDYKILLPYYFELQNPIDNPTEYVEYLDIKVKLKSNYFKFNEADFEPINKSISKNTIYKLEYNHYAFPEMRNTIETASIPSSMPLDQQTANGEYSKYQVKTFSCIEKDIEILKNEYGNGIIDFNPLANSKVVNNGKFIFENDLKINISEIKLSSFFGAGLWRITLVDQNKNNINLDLELFDKTDSTISFINLIL
ncbi:hypothetical protein [Spiroplasma endosymbiont of Diplazon laetatorius]|uniref:hypothetical protein n=1 Tax=Spiroplasma endosymbiont of Diplazon laetatorius TaxID=3066322 RepID=UPI0030CD80A3